MSGLLSSKKYKKIINKTSKGDEHSNHGGSPERSSGHETNNINNKYSNGYKHLTSPGGTAVW